MWLELLLLVGALGYLFYKWATLHNNTFEQRGIPHEKPSVLVGTFGDVVKNKSSFAKIVLEQYKKYRQSKIFGIFMFREPVYVLNDLESIKKITIKDFANFPNHHPFFPTDNDELLDGMLSIMKDQRWKNMRNTLSPVFTTSKMRAMYTLMSQCFQEGINYFKDEVAKGGGTAEINMKDGLNRLSNDLIATTAFGLKVNSFEDRQNEFYSIGQAFTSFRRGQMLTVLLLTYLPTFVSKLLKLSLFDSKTTSYFMRLVLDTMEYRTKNNIVRPDMIHLLMEAKKDTSSQEWSDEEIVAQCLIFFFAAFENNSNLTCAVCHELCDNPDVQQKLYEECVEIRENLQGATLDYDTIAKMKYMEMVVSETLRKWALAPFTDRVCSKDYTLTDDDDKVLFEFKKGDRIFIPLIGIQWDERYFEKPEQFMPERFSEENKDSVQQMANLPFGIGPRICIGNRYALMQTKAMLYYMVLDFEFKRSPKTVKNVLDDLRGFQGSPSSGFWLNLVKRNK